MNDEIMSLIHDKCKYVLGIRKIKNYVEIQIPCMYKDSEISWIPLFQASIECEKVVNKWIEMGGAIQNAEG